MDQRRAWLFSGLMALTAACGSGDPGDAADARTGDNPCGFSEDRYLPYQPGHSWTYRVVDLATGSTSTKSQALTSESDPDFGEVVIQTTTKDNGRTISALKRVDDAILRLRQIDEDAAGVEERVTVYDPGQNRIDESPERLVAGAQWDDTYTIIVTDAQGVETTGDRVDRWEVLGVDVDCSSPLGNFKCLHLRKQRIVGGVSDKQYFFAKGIGKVKETNANQLEELVSCE